MPVGPSIYDVTKWAEAAWCAEGVELQPSDEFTDTLLMETLAQARSRQAGDEVLLARLVTQMDELIDAVKLRRGVVEVLRHAIMRRLELGPAVAPNVDADFKATTTRARAVALTNEGIGK